MMNRLILGMTLAGLVAGVASAWPWQAATSVDSGAPNVPPSRTPGPAPRTAERRQAPARQPGSSPEAAEAFTERLRDSDVDIGFAHTDGGFDFAVDQTGQLNDDGLKRMNVPAEAKPKVQKIIDQRLEQIRADLLSRVHAGARGTDPAKGVMVYDIPGDVEVGKSYLEQTERELAAVVTREQAARLRRNMDGLLAGLGRQGTRITVTTDLATGATSILTATYNPYTGVINQTRKVVGGGADHRPLDCLGGADRRISTLAWLFPFSLSFSTS